MTSIEPESEIAQATKPAKSLLHRAWWKQSWYIWDYVVREITTPLIMSLVIIMFVFLLQFLMRFIDKIVGRGLDLWTIVQLIVFNLAWMVVLAVPMAVLVSCVMGFGALSASNELTAMKAAGVSLGRLLFPVVILGLAIGWFDLQFNNDVLPDANHKAKDLMSDIQRKKPTFSIEPGKFSDDDAIPGYSILSRKVNPITNELETVTIYDQSQSNETKVITAKRGKIAFTSDFRSVIMTLYDGEFHQFNNTLTGDYRRGTFQQYVVHVPTNGFDFMRQGESERGDREMSAKVLMSFVRKKDSTYVRLQKQLEGHLTSQATSLTRPIPAQQQFVPSGNLEMGRTANLRGVFQPQLSTIETDVALVTQSRDDVDSYMVEVHKKYAIPVACIVFVLLGVPLGALAKRSGVGVGVGMSIGFFVMYWIFLIGGEKLADRGKLSPFLGMWGGNILLTLFGIYLTWRVATERPGVGFATLFKSLGFKRKRKTQVVPGA
jgi:lipopolysaccharide export system permease protein